MVCPPSRRHLASQGCTGRMRPGGGGAASEAAARSDASAPYSCNTFFAKSSPTVIISKMTALLVDHSRPTLAHQMPPGAVTPSGSSINCLDPDASVSCGW